MDIFSIFLLVIGMLLIFALISAIIRPIIRIIFRRRYPFSGRIDSYTDVNRFILHYDDFFIEDNPDDPEGRYFFILTHTDYSRPYGYGVYYVRHISYPPDISRLITRNIRIFIWEHRDIINAELKERQEKHEKFLQSEYRKSIVEEDIKKQKIREK